MNWIEREKELFIPVFKRLPVEIDHGEGCYLYDRKGNRYLDFLGGLGVNALGYGHPDILAAIERQLRRNMHLSNYFVQDIQLELAEKILTLAGYDRIFFSNSGTESIEGILKLIKKWANLNHKTEIICFEQAFHGRSLGALSITAQPKYQRDFLPLLPQIISVPYNDADRLREVAGPQTAAIFLEFIQGEGGVVPADQAFVQAIAQIQHEYGALVVADEIQSGVGRTGKFLGFQHYGIKPDLVAIAKAIGGGLPLGAFFLTEALSTVFKRGEHGTTFGGNPVACAAGLATLEVLERDKIMHHVVETGGYLREKLLALQKRFPSLIRDVRGLGLMLGMELSVESYPIVLEGLDHGMIYNATAGNVLRFLPPLIIQKQQVDEGVEVLAEILAKR